MAEAAALKRELFTLIDAMRPDGGLSEEDFAHLQQLTAQIAAVSPVPEPIHQLPRVQGRWENLFAHFGARHSAGKTRVHDSDLRTQTFSQFAPLAIRATRLCQEISVNGAAYNNVVSFEAPDKSFCGNIIVRGIYRADPGGNPKRFGVEFYQAELHPQGSASEAALRQQLGLGSDAPLEKAFKSPRLHSDIVYLDDDIRINVGSYGGLYVLRRLNEAGVSVAVS